MINIVKVKVINKAKHNYGLPSYADLGSSGMDVRASLDGNLWIDPNEVALIPTGLFMAIPVGYEIQVRPRSGLAAKHGVTVLNTPGTLDASYRGEICVILKAGPEGFMVENGDRIAQLVLCEVPMCKWDETDTLDETERGDGGFGHTGIK